MFKSTYKILDSCTTDCPITSVPPSALMGLRHHPRATRKMKSRAQKKEVSRAHKSLPNIVWKILSIVSTSKHSFLSHKRQCKATARAICLFSLLATENLWKCVCPLCIVLPAYSSELFIILNLCSTLSAWKRWLLKCPVNSHRMWSSTRRFTACLVRLSGCKAWPTVCS